MGAQINYLESIEATVIFPGSIMSAVATG